MDKAPDYESGDSVGSNPTTPSKQCPRCERKEPEVVFGRSRNRSDGKQPYCVGCQKQYTRQHYAKNTAYYKTKNKRRKQEVRQFLFEYLSAHKCTDCPESDPIVLTFDHIESKSFNIADAVNDGYSLENVKKEISKCQVRCFNCHARKTAKQFGWYKDLTSGVPYGGL